MRNSSIRLSTFLLFISLMLLGAGAAYGLTSVEITAGTSCGNAFSAMSSDQIPSEGVDPCAELRSNRKALTWALLAPGIIGLVCAGGVGLVNSWSPQTRESRPAGDPQGS